MKKEIKQDFFTLIKERCDNACVICGFKFRLKLHRIDPRGGDDMRNWIVLCEFCQDKLKRIADKNNPRLNPYGIKSLRKILFRNTVVERRSFSDKKKEKTGERLIASGFQEKI